MIPLDKALHLPSISGVGAVPDSLVNYAVAPPATLVNESFASVQNRFGGVGPFTSLNVGAPSFASLGAASSLGTLPTSSPYGTIAASVTTGVQSSDATAAQVNSNTDASNSGNEDHKVRLVSTIDGLLVQFDVMPEIGENRTAEYESLQASQMPGEFQKYKGTKSTSWSINAMFVCRNRDQALENLSYVRTLRSWVMPYFGDKQSATLRGSPPPVLMLSGWRGIVGPVPVIMMTMNWNWPKDCDWIPTGEFDSSGQEIPFPTVFNVQFTLVESYSATQFNNFDLLAFQNGDMVGAFSTSITSSQSLSVAEPVVTQGPTSNFNGGLATSTPTIPAPKTSGAVDEILNNTLGGQSQFGFGSSIPGTDGTT